MSEIVTKQDLLNDLENAGVVDVEVLMGEEITVTNFIPTLSQYKIYPPESFFSRLAERLGLSYMDNADLLSRVDHGNLLPYTVEEQLQIILLEINPDFIRVATANPLDEEIFARLHSLFHKSVEKVVVSNKAVAKVSDSGFQGIHGYSALNELVDRQPDESAYRILLPWQKGAVVLIALVILFLLSINPYYIAFVLFTLVNIIYFVMNPVKFYISIQGLTGTKKVIHVSEQEIKALLDADLPVYTILVPLYHEAEMLAHILKNISNLRYPREKLDVKILLEEDDEETISRARSLGLFGNISETIAPMSLPEYRKFLSIFYPVVIPAAEVKTKPRACNYGLKRSRGEFVVIYDAEDYPEPDQLKKAVVAFRKAGDEYACIQCLLNFYNARKNMLTRWFSVEYSYYYDYYIQGLDKINAPIPLGGTSNHFRVKTLRELGAWDPFNVTEDADLGMRIARKKKKTGVLNSHTYEEATSSVRGWIRQRSRWVKGFIITWLVTMRYPVKVFKDIGFKNYLVFQLAFGGNFFMPIMNLFLWLVFACGFIIPEYFSRWFDFWPFAVIAVFNLIVGNLFYITLMMLATYKEKQYDLVMYSLFSPIYWLLMSVGAWKGIIQLLTKPYKWEKTAHGSTFSTDTLTDTDPKDFSRPVRSIEVPFPEVKNGRTSVTPWQMAFSVGVTLLMILFALVIFGYIVYEPVSERFTITSIPGLHQAIAPIQRMQAGQDPHFINTEGLISPGDKPPDLLIHGSGTATPLPSPPIREKPERAVLSVESPFDSGLKAWYDPSLKVIGISTNQTGIVEYLVLVTWPDKPRYSGSIDPLSHTLIIPAGDLPAQVLVTKVYSDGTEFLVLNVTL